MSREVLADSEIRQAFTLYKSCVKIEDIAAHYYVSTRTLERMFARRKLRKSVGDKQEKKR